MSTPAETISIAKISQYLWDETIDNENLLFGGTIDPRKAIQLYMERKALEYGNTNNLSGLDGVSNYVYALCGAKLPIAKNILQVGSGGGSVVPSGGGNGVREYSSFASAGSTSIIFIDAINSTLLYCSRGGIDVGAILTSGVPTGNQVRWDSPTGTLTVAADVPFDIDEFVRILVK
jgi:hypothetical protein